MLEHIENALMMYNIGCVGMFGKAFKKCMNWALEGKFAFGDEAMAPVLQRCSWRWEERGLGVQAIAGVLQCRYEVG